jgi:hypothetical protein
MNPIEAIVACSLLAVLSGCRMCTPESAEWRRAEASIGREERWLTNGMAWPTNGAEVETAMSAGMSIKVTNAEGTMTITAGEGYARTYSWDGEARTVTLWPRAERWHGKFGIYYPGSGEHWRPNHGITRGVLEEAVVWFNTENDALAWIGRHHASSYTVYSRNGLLVFWRKVAERKQINVVVLQVWVGGKRPGALSGSRDDLIEVTGTNRVTNNGP